MCEPDKHRWPRLSSIRQTTSWYDREMWSCNDCGATKVVINVTSQSSGAETRKEVVIEPPAEGQREIRLVV